MAWSCRVSYRFSKTSNIGRSIDAFIYHRHVDHSQEGGLRLGLWRNVAGSIADPESKKPIYEVFRKAGTSEWRQATDPLLPITGLNSWDQVLEAIIR